MENKQTTNHFFLVLVEVNFFNDLTKVNCIFYLKLYAAKNNGTVKTRYIYLVSTEQESKLI